MIMRKIYDFVIAGAALLLLCSCGLDNYKIPSIKMTGNIVYNGENIHVRQGTVTFDLYQEGYELNEPIKVYVAQDGTFSALLYPGTYTMTATDNNGPWLNGSEPVKFELKADTEIDYQVTPYFALEDVAIVLNGNNVRAVCNVSKIAGDLSSRRLSLFVGHSAIVGDNNYNYALRSNQMPVNLGGNSLSCNAEELLKSSNAIYARLGLQIDGISEMIYSKVIQLK